MTSAVTAITKVRFAGLQVGGSCPKDTPISLRLIHRWMGPGISKEPCLENSIKVREHLSGQREPDFLGSGASICRNV